MPELVVRREEHAAELGPDARFRLSAVKIMADGVVENGTAAMLDPYLGAVASEEHPAGIAFVDRGVVVHVSGGGEGAAHERRA